MSNYFIIYKGTGKKELVPEVIAVAIWEAKTPKIKWKSKLGIRTLDLVEVGKLISEEEYYQLNPNERPEKEILSLPKTKYYNKVGSLKALTELKKGLEKFLKENPDSKLVPSLYKKLNERIEKIKNGKEINTTINNLIKL